MLFHAYTFYIPYFNAYIFIFLIIACSVCKMSSVSMFSDHLTLDNQLVCFFLWRTIYSFTYLFLVVWGFPWLELASLQVGFFLLFFGFFFLNLPFLRSSEGREREREERRNLCLTKRIENCQNHIPMVLEAYIRQNLRHFFLFKTVKVSKIFIGHLVIPVSNKV